MTAKMAPQVKEMLGGLGPAEFVQLPRDQRNNVYKRHLVKQEGNVRVDEADDDNDLNPEITQGVILMQEWCVGSDEAGRQIMQEAREIYYMENSFEVRSHWLREFLADTLVDGKARKVEELVRMITVIVDIRHPWQGQGHVSKSKGERKSEAVQDLEQLLKCADEVELIMIEIRGGGAADGSDLGTQMKIKEICKIVKELISKFGDERVRIWKRLQLPAMPAQKFLRNLTGYWKAPGVGVKDRLWASKTTSFEELMQVQIEDWTHVVSDRIGGEGWDWASVL